MAQAREERENLAAGDWSRDRRTKPQPQVLGVSKTNRGGANVEEEALPASELQPLRMLL